MSVFNGVIVILELMFLNSPWHYHINIKVPIYGDVCIFEVSVRRCSTVYTIHIIIMFFNLTDVCSCTVVLAIFYPILCQYFQILVNISNISGP